MDLFASISEIVFKVGITASVVMLNMKVNKLEKQGSAGTDPQKKQRTLGVEGGSSL